MMKNNCLPFGKRADRVSGMNPDNITTRLRRAIESSDRSRYALAKESGVSESTLCKFMAGGSLRLDSVDRLCDVLELELTPKRKTKSKK
jgi:DNA-binding Xre family transcriptional regulator